MMDTEPDETSQKFRDHVQVQEGFGQVGQTIGYIIRIAVKNMTTP